MYCPRCGSQNTETTKFCRQCGLALLEVTTYVATGGTSALTPPPAPPASQIIASFSPKQKMWLAILGFILLTPVAAITSETIGLDVLVPLCAVLMPLGIVISVMYFRNQARLLEHAQRGTPPNPPLPQQAYVPPPLPQAYLQAPVMPVNNVAATNVPRQTPNTNPFAQQPASVIEDETKRLPS